jgi:hypothetical protein
MTTVLFTGKPGFNVQNKHFKKPVKETKKLRDFNITDPKLTQHKVRKPKATQASSTLTPVERKAKTPKKSRVSLKLHPIAKRWIEETILMGRPVVESLQIVTKPQIGILSIEQAFSGLSLKKEKLVNPLLARRAGDSKAAKPTITSKINHPTSTGPKAAHKIGKAPPKRSFSTPQPITAMLSDPIPLSQKRKIKSFPPKLSLNIQRVKASLSNELGLLAPPQAPIVTTPPLGGYFSFNTVSIPSRPSPLGPSPLKEANPVKPILSPFTEIVESPQMTASEQPLSLSIPDMPTLPKPVLQNSLSKIEMEVPTFQESTTSLVEKGSGHSTVPVITNAAGQQKSKIRMRRRGPNGEPLPRKLTRSHRRNRHTVDQGDLRRFQIAAVNDEKITTPALVARYKYRNRQQIFDASTTEIKMPPVKSEPEKKNQHIDDDDFNVLLANWKPMQPIPSSDRNPFTHP